MAAVNKKVHLIKMDYNYCRAICDNYLCVFPIEDLLNTQAYKKYYALGTFNPKRVTCKRCLKHFLYKQALDKVNHPLFYWKNKV